MNVRIGLYDFFAYTIPGWVYLFVFTYILVRLQIIQITQPTQDFILSATGILFITIIAYTSGLIFDFFTSKWVRLFRSKNFSQQIFDEFIRKHPNIRIKFLASDWQILIAKIRLENIENGVTIEQNNVTNLMLRNLAFGFLLFGCTQLVEFILAKGTLNLALMIIFFLLTILAQKQSTKFARLFFVQIFEYTVAKDLMDAKLAEYKLPVQQATPKQTKS